MTQPKKTVLVFGYGNPGRLDDGLGPALVAALEPLGFDGVDYDADYQLVVEDAAQVASHDVAIFVDADTSGPEPFYLRRLEPDRVMGFSTHSVRPGAVLALGQELFQARTTAYVMGIRGYEFNEYEERLSEAAQANLAAAVDYLKTALPARDFQEYNIPAGELQDTAAASDEEGA